MTARTMLPRPWAPVLCVLAAAGCAPVGTFLNETTALTSGQTQQQIDAAQARQNAARAENVALRDQLAAIQAQQTALHDQLAASQTRLRGIERKLASTTSATQAARDQYQRLVQKQQDLQHELAVESLTPPPADPAAAAAQQARLNALAAEKDELARQVDALQKAL